MATYKTTRVCAGAYKVTGMVNGELRTVNVDYHEHLKGWIAAAEWDRHRYTDQVETKRQAIKAAYHMLDTPEV